jgi:predicted Zn-dependent peptidase
MVNTGSRDEAEHENGMAHFIEHLIFKGTKKRKAYHVLSRIENVGGELNAYTTKEETCIYASFLHPYYDVSLELFADVAFNSVFPVKEIRKEKDIIMDEINSYNDSPAELIFDDFEALIFDGHPLARNILGDADHVKRFRKKDVLDFVKRKYSTKQMVIASVGQIKFDKLVHLVEKYFGNIKPTETDNRRIPFTGYKAQIKKVDKESYQSHCMVGNLAYRSNHPKKMTLLLLNNLLGGPALNSRLSLGIREKYGFAYGIESVYQPYSDTGMFGIYLGTDPAYVDRGIELVIREMKKLAGKKLGNIQLQRAKRQLVGQLAINYESKLNEMLAIAKSHLNNPHVKTYEEILSGIENITAEDVLEVANEVFAPDDMSILIYNARENDKS